MTTDTQAEAAELLSGALDLAPMERVVFGRPAAEAVVEEMARAGLKRAFVTSTRSLARAEGGPLARVIAGLGDACVGIYDHVSAHSPEAEVIEIARAARAAGADVLVPVGGGSVIDTTKAVQICLEEGVDTVEGLRAQADRWKPSSDLRPKGEIRAISVSTTLSAAEFTGIAGISNPEAGVKHGFSKPVLIPRVAVLDPASTDTTPLELLVSTGMRAMDHACEAFCSPTANPMTDLYALGAAHRLSRALPAIRERPDDLLARQDAQFGMWQAILALTGGAGSGASHGIGYALGAGFGVPHGVTSCVMLPAVMRWNAAVNGERQRTLAAALGDPGRAAGDLLAELVQVLGVPGSLQAAGLTEADLPTLAEKAMGYGPVRRNPRKIAGPQDVREILELAF
ncbi:iron-containing alcohol dehydrogenase [Albimonas sp. CAU 1670]|uniref:iron-containing alcohol dehydrogenase n=1 Tax=Albimonas sp. CAU 1670 TaxID=3032599 RepID=UPI0023DBCF13|nr:iron-containing alcohol dehydrogenase [Albimonas sp. CAU 1670]MDF2233662.1 iron-containing alcohol dehydrogenase [Albimonas sp. CAU 1670]